MNIDMLHMQYPHFSHQGLYILFSNLIVPQTSVALRLPLCYYAGSVIQRVAQLWIISSSSLSLCFSFSHTYRTNEIKTTCIVRTREQVCVICACSSQVHRSLQPRTKYKHTISHIKGLSNTDS